MTKNIGASVSTIKQMLKEEGLKASRSIIVSP
jgi:hypothetical protein